jgi:hypothetical protein
LGEVPVVAVGLRVSPVAVEVVVGAAALGRPHDLLSRLSFCLIRCSFKLVLVVLAARLA